MNPFRKRSKATITDKEKLSLSKNGLSIPLDVTLALPPEHDFRTSLLMPKMADRFSILRMEEERSQPMMKERDLSILEEGDEDEEETDDMFPGKNFHVTPWEKYEMQDRKAPRRMKSAPNVGTKSAKEEFVKARAQEGNSLFSGKQRMFKYRGDHSRAGDIVREYSSSSRSSISHSPGLEYPRRSSSHTSSTSSIFPNVKQPSSTNNVSQLGFDFGLANSHHDQRLIDQPVSPSPSQSSISTVYELVDSPTLPSFADGESSSVAGQGQGQGTTAVGLVREHLRQPSHISTPHPIASHEQLSVASHGRKASDDSWDVRRETIYAVNDQQDLDEMFWDRGELYSFYGNTDDANEGENEDRDHVNSGLENDGVQQTKPLMPRRRDNRGDILWDKEEPVSLSASGNETQTVFNSNRLENRDSVVVTTKVLNVVHHEPAPIPPSLNIPVANMLKPGYRNSDESSMEAFPSPSRLPPFINPAAFQSGSQTTSGDERSTDKERFVANVVNDIMNNEKLARGRSLKNSDSMSGRGRSGTVGSSSSLSSQNAFSSHTSTLPIPSGPQSPPLLFHEDPLPPIQTLIPRKKSTTKELARALKERNISEPTLQSTTNTTPTIPIVRVADGKLEKLRSERRKTGRMNTMRTKEIDPLEPYSQPMPPAIESSFVNLKQQNGSSNGSASGPRTRVVKPPFIDPSKPQVRRALSPIDTSDGTLARALSPPLLMTQPPRSESPIYSRSGNSSPILDISNPPMVPPMKNPARRAMSPTPGRLMSPPPTSFSSSLRGMPSGPDRVMSPPPVRLPSSTNSVLQNSMSSAPQSKRHGGTMSPPLIRRRDTTSGSLLFDDQLRDNILVPSTVVQGTSGSEYGHNTRQSDVLQRLAMEYAPVSGLAMHPSHSRGQGQLTGLSQQRQAYQYPSDYQQRHPGPKHRRKVSRGPDIDPNNVHSSPAAMHDWQAPGLVPRAPVRDERVDPAW